MNISDCISQMLEYKESLGYSRSTYELYLADFKRYFEKTGAEEFTAESVLPWCAMRPFETPTGFKRRLVPLRELSKYLSATGQADFILPLTLFPITHREPPYIISDSELISFFNGCDKLPYCKSSPYRHLIIPVIFRLIYFCGLRPNEGREIKREDFNFSSKTLLIRRNKTNKERLIPVSADVTEMCQVYSEKMGAISPDTEYLFPSLTGGPCRKKWLAESFRHIWNTAFPDKTNVHARTYLLRHRFATAVIMKWLDEGVDFYSRLPYLSAYMGHSHFEETAYYIHLLPENLLQSKSVDWERLSNLIPEVEDDD